MYRPFKRLGDTAEVVVYAGEYHEFKTPSHTKERLESDSSRGMPTS